MHDVLCEQLGLTEPGGLGTMPVDVRQITGPR
jgi:hypothetical protein